MTTILCSFSAVHLDPFIITKTGKEKKRENDLISFDGLMYTHTHKKRNIQLGRFSNDDFDVMEIIKE